MQNKTLKDIVPLPFTLRQCVFPVFILICSVLSLYVMAVFFIGSNLGADNGAWNTPRLRPYAYRQLITEIANSISYLLPEGVWHALEIALQWVRDSSFGQRLIATRYPLSSLPLPLQNDHLVDTFILMLVIYAALIAFLWALYKTARSLFPDSYAYAYCAPLLALLLLPVTAVKYGYSYDFAELFFSTYCFYLLYQRRWLPYLVWFALATFNKGTNIFIVVFFVMYFYSRLPWRTYLQLLAAQILLWGSITLLITSIFADREGVMFTHAVYVWSNLFYTWGYGYYGVLAVLASVILIVSHWQEKPEFLRVSVGMVLANFVVFFVICIFDEARDMYWSYPVLLLLASHTLVRGSGLNEIPIFKTTGGTERPIRV